MISLVAGATGFAGINIVEALLERGDEVVAFGHTALPATATQPLARFAKQLRVVVGDVRESLHAISKFAAERVALRLRQLWQLDLVCARLGSVIGPWERDTGVRDTLSPHLQKLLPSGRR